MARTREFEEDVVLERALAAFWTLGYDACSVRDLTRATGLKPQSLYNAFGDKRALYLAALRKYRAHVKASLWPLEADGAGLPELRAYFEGFLALLKARGVSTCLLIKTAFGGEANDPLLRAEVDDSGAEVRAAFAAVLSRAAARGEARVGTSPRAGAAFLFTALHGLSALAHTGASKAEVDAAIAHTFASFAASNVPRPRARARASSRKTT